MREVRALRKAAVTELRRAGFPAAREEIRAMIDAAGGDPGLWRCWADRRRHGEPLEWLLGFTVFMGHRVIIDRGVYVPRPQTELIARRAIEALPDRGIAVDLCTGSGAVALALHKARPGARVVATDIDPDATRCAAKNGVEVFQGHLADPLPAEFMGHVDVVVAVVPYVPTDQIEFLPRDVRTYEPLLALDGGVHGMELLEQVAHAASSLLRAGGSLLLELGGDQDAFLNPALRATGFELVERCVDEDGDLRGVHARFACTPEAT